MSAKRKWTAIEEEKLVSMARNGLGRTAIAVALNQSIASIQQKAFWLKISVAEPDQMKLRRTSNLR
jgi:hypothetical protein